MSSSSSAWSMSGDEKAGSWPAPWGRSGLEAVFRAAGEVVGVGARQVDLVRLDRGLEAGQRLERRARAVVGQHAVQADRLAHLVERGQVQRAVTQQVALGHRLDDVAGAGRLQPL